MNPLPESSERWTRDRLALLLFFLFWILYEMTLTRVFSYDGLCYMLDVEFGPPSHLFHPNHLLYTFTARLIFETSRWLGYRGRAIYVVQVFNAGIGALAVLGFFQIVSKRLGSFVGAVGVALLGFSHVVWMEVSDPNGYAWVLLSGVLLLGLLLDTERFHAFFVGLAHGFLSLYQELFIGLAPVFLWKINRGAASRRESFRRAALYVAGLGVSNALLYGLTALTFHRGSASEAASWSVFGLTETDWWSFSLRKDLLESARALLQCFIAPGGSAWVYRSGECLIVVFAFAALFSLFRNWKNADPCWRNNALCLGLWVILLNGFLLFFGVGMLRYRLFVIAPLLYLLLIAAQKSKRVVAILGVLALGLGIWNYVYAIAPCRQLDSDALRTRWLLNALPPHSVFVFEGGAGRSITNVYWAYFAPGHPGRSLQGYLFEHPDGDMTLLNQWLSAESAAGLPLFFESTLMQPLEKRFTPWSRNYSVEETMIGPGGYSVSLVRVSRA